jgi:hypothetical protein
VEKRKAVSFYLIIVGGDLAGANFRGGGLFIAFQAGALPVEAIRTVCDLSLISIEVT